MRAIYRAHRRVIEKMYEDRATINRYTEYEDPDTTETKLGLFPVYEDVPCRISQVTLDMDRQTETVNEVLYETKLFISPDIKIKKGDVIEVTRRGVTREYKAGEPFVYHSYQEVSLQREDEA